MLVGKIYRCIKSFNGLRHRSNRVHVVKHRFNFTVHQVNARISPSIRVNLTRIVQNWWRHALLPAGFPGIKVVVRRRWASTSVSASAPMSPLPDYELPRAAAAPQRFYLTGMGGWRNTNGTTPVPWSPPDQLLAVGVLNHVRSEAS